MKIQKSDDRYAGNDYCESETSDAEEFYRRDRKQNENNDEKRRGDEKRGIFDLFEAPPFHEYAAITEYENNQRDEKYSQVKKNEIIVQVRFLEFFD